MTCTVASGAFAVPVDRCVATLRLSTGDAGTGTLTAVRYGDMLVLKLSVTTIDGMPIEATVGCEAP